MREASTSRFCFRSVEIVRNLLLCGRSRKSFVLLYIIRISRSAKLLSKGMRSSRINRKIAVLWRRKRFPRFSAYFFLSPVFERGVWVGWCIPRLFSLVQNSFSQVEIRRASKGIFAFLAFLVSNRASCRRFYISAAHWCLS